MHTDAEIEQWLQGLPLNKPIDIDGDTVFLNIHGNGAELGAYLLRDYTQAQLQAALQMGFASALAHEAGLARTLDGKALVLTQWLPQVRWWPQAAKPLEALLNQLAEWRAVLAPSAPAWPPSGVDRRELHLRTLLTGENS